MKTLSQSNYRPSWLFGAFCTLLIVSMPAMSVKKHPSPLYTPASAVFAACDRVTGANLIKCCKKRTSICYSECKVIEGPIGKGPRGPLYRPGGGPGALVGCWWDCDNGKDRCNDSEKAKKQIAWPGEGALAIPGVFIDDSRIVTDDGVGLSISTDTAIFEVRRDNVERGQSACVAIAATCNCSNGLEYDTSNKECRPTITSGAVGCSICSTVKSSEDCKPCNDCLPVVLSAQPCAGVELDGDKAPKSTP